MTNYEEFRTRALTDPAFRKWVIRMIPEVLEQTGLDGRSPVRKVPPGLITYEQAAELVGTRQCRVRQMVSDGYLDNVRIGKLAYVNRTEFLHAVLGHCLSAQRERALLLLGDEAYGSMAAQAANRAAHVPEGYISYHDAGCLVGAEPSRVRQMVSSGRISSIMVMNRAYVHRTEFLRFVAERSHAEKRQRALALLVKDTDAPDGHPVLLAANG